MLTKNQCVFLVLKVVPEINKVICLCEKQNRNKNLVQIAVLESKDYPFFYIKQQATSPETVSCLFCSFTLPQKNSKSDVNLTNSKSQEQSTYVPE